MGNSGLLRKDSSVRAGEIAPIERFLFTIEGRDEIDGLNRRPFDPSAPLSLSISSESVD